MNKSMHGTTNAIGCSHARLGNFCKQFPKLKTWTEDAGLKDQCQIEAACRAIGGMGGLMHDQRNESADSEVPAAYTFLAQFIDHDLTLDTTTPLHGEQLSNDAVDELANLRSTSLDLDCVYGLGPEADPFMYDDSQHGRLLVGSSVDGVSNPNDVPRNQNGRAMIGDPRNDENLFISQLQLAFLKFHNKQLVASNFEKAQEETRYHYQSIVLNDFLKRICDEEVYCYALRGILDSVGRDKKAYPHFPALDDCGRVCMPVEFSVAGYRFGHSLVRSSYPANSKYPVIDLFDERFGTLGFSPVPNELVVDWRFLTDIDPCHPYAKSKAFDHLLADELMRLPNPVVGRNTSDDDRSLAFRNVLRSHVLGLASGQSIASALQKAGYPVDPAADLAFADIPGWKCRTASLDFKLEAHTPLFFYIMREAAVLGGGKRLGPVGSALLMETFGTIFVYCGSYLRDPGWKPNRCISGDDTLTLADFLAYVDDQSCAGS